MSRVARYVGRNVGVAHVRTSSSRARARPRLRSWSAAVPYWAPSEAILRRIAVRGMLGGERDATEDLERPVCDVERRARGPRLCDGGGPEIVRLALVECRGGVEHARPRALDLDEHVGEQVADRLEAADRLAELASLRRVLSREGEDAPPLRPPPRQTARTAATAATRSSGASASPRTSGVADAPSRWTSAASSVRSRIVRAVMATPGCAGATRARPGRPSPAATETTSASARRAKRTDVFSPYTRPSLSIVAGERGSKRRSGSLRQSATAWSDAPSASGPAT